MRVRQRTAALLEVLGVYLAGQLVTGQLIRLLGLRPVNPLARLTVAVTDAELLTATWQLFGLVTLQYVGWFLLIIPINYWHRRRGAAAYGLTRAGHSWTDLMAAGLATAALCLWPTLAVDLVNAIHPVGETVPWRQALFDTSWRRWQFWLFTGVLSWGLVAVVEEIFFRGYCQRRLAEDWGDAAAIAGITCLFIFSHTQYLTFNAYNAAKLPTLLLVALGSGVVFAKTRSLVPSIVAHAIGNVPMTPFWQAAVVAALIVGTVVAARRGATVVRQVFSGATVIGCVGLGVIGTAYAIASARVEGLGFVAAAMVVLAIVLEAEDRGRQPADTDLAVG
jgi:membrane protease YdiL (CAAX protease family)